MDKFVQKITRPVTLVWLRKELRLADNAALYHALKEHDNVVLLYIFDKEELSAKDDHEDARVSFVYQSLEVMEKELACQKKGLWVTYGKPLSILEKLVQNNKVTALYINEDYTPKSIAQEEAVAFLLHKYNKPALRRYKDRIIFGKNEILTNETLPYRIYTPYMKKWKATYTSSLSTPFPSISLLDNLSSDQAPGWPTLQEMGFYPTKKNLPSRVITPSLLNSYEKNRNQLALKGTSSLGVHLHFGTISIRQATQIAQQHSEAWLNQLIWRNFFIMILSHFPRVAEESFRPAYEKIAWLDDLEDFQAWCQGKTGYPLVDAGMRELNTTGLMHNRARMITASFLTKSLLINWRWGEAYFAEKLLDYDLALNNGNWQWVAGCGCDAAPYFRIFNPMRQAERFDPEGMYIKKWIPEYHTPSYPKPIVEYTMARQRALNSYRKALREE